MPSLAQGVVKALAQELNTNAVVQVVIAGSSTGAGTGTLAAANGTVFTQFLNTAFVSSGITGPDGPSIAKGIGEGVATWMKSGIITTVDVGTPVFPFNSSTGVGTGTIF